MEINFGPKIAIQAIHHKWKEAVARVIADQKRIEVQTNELLERTRAGQNMASNIIIENLKIENLIITTIHASRHNPKKYLEKVSALFLQILWKC